ncbi:alpha/beta hydrolase [Nitratireductor sp. XY-223]|uniref:alpha/beta fold hydrolase n=1 Tax=Nitratireductor sp. XY-223 TaxID=2561926 RepID=UPI0010AACB84|nr:alpha/beta hydrolase [Nitratireductor sp. XY-223]
MTRMIKLLAVAAAATAMAMPAKSERLAGLVPSTVTSPDGVTIAVVESGETDGPTILFVHGFSQSAAAWRNQMLSDLADTHHMVAFDLRGHGYSAKPEDPKNYIDSKLWADDIAAVIADKQLDDVVLVGWSYGGLPVLDYVAEHGEDKLSGLVFVATGYNLDLRPPDAGGPEPVLGPGVVENTGPMAGIPAGPPDADLDGCAAAGNCGDYGRQLAGTRRFLEMVPGTPLSEAAMAEALAYNLQTPPYVRRAMVVDRFVVGGPLDHSPTLGTITVPVLLMHGTKDQHVLPRSTEIMKELIEAGGGSTQRIVLEGFGHAPFVEDPARFNTELKAFVSGL